MKKVTVLLLALMSLFSCSKKETTSTIVIKLTDSPGDYEKVNIDLQSVEVHSLASGTGDWIPLECNTGIYDLLTLTNGVETIIASDSYPSGRISQLRLILGDNNSVVIGGVEEMLKIPSGSESGLKVNVNTELKEGITYAILLDFDAAKSIVRAGSSGKYNLKPVIKAITKAQDGAIRGQVFPSELNVAVYALSGSDTISASYAVEGESNFFVGGLQAGSYTIVLDPGETSGYQEATIDNIETTLGKVIMLDPVTLTQ